ncbi:MAG: arginine--tRNA ligase [Cyanobium sp. LacPavin_0920_WC12_MAG_62_9]|nr:arginine--tRNA ligase [Cyanobium sp. LacPavin_0920_WC12_MAG_62_9]
MLRIAQTLHSQLVAAMERAFPEAAAQAETAGKPLDPQLAAASKPEFGDFQANGALPLAKPLGQAPRQIAAAIVEQLAADPGFAELCEAPQIAGPGFINLTLRPELLAAEVQARLGDPRLGVPSVEGGGDGGAGTPVIVDFSSPNIAKEMHVGHLRSTIIGDSLARVLEFRGHPVLRLNHVGDWGTQFGMLITHLKQVAPQVLETADAVDLGDLVAFYRQAKQRFDGDEAFQTTSREEVVKLQGGDPISRKAFLEGVSGKDGNPLPVIVQKTDGGFNYATTDLAAIRYRFGAAPEGDGARRVIYVTDSGQANHFAGVFQVARRAGWIPADGRLEHVPFGLVQGEDGKKLKTRSGDTVRLKDLLDEAVERSKADLCRRLQEEERSEDGAFIEQVATTVGLAAVKYADLSQNRNTNYQFSFDRMLALQGNTAPYLLYAVVRIAGIARKGGDMRAAAAALHFSEPQEWALVRELLKLDAVIAEVEEELLPNRLCSYLFELSQVFNRFYDQVPVLKAEEPSRSSRLALCRLTADTLKLGLGLLGIATLERM